MTRYIPKSLVAQISELNQQIERLTAERDALRAFVAVFEEDERRCGRAEDRKPDAYCSHVCIAPKLRAAYQQIEGGK